jgi:pyrimidine operon attenuation protein / uracil phosphoribosyltransferase
MESREILSNLQFQLTIQRLAHQLIEEHGDFSQSMVIGIQPRGIELAERLAAIISTKLDKIITAHKLDITFHRDDLHRTDEIHVPSITQIEETIENKDIILIDDVLYSGRTIRSALDALMDFGRPHDIELLVLIDRRLHRHMPIKAKYIGKSIDSVVSEHVVLDWEKDRVMILPKTK